jgi:hypothetical protein
MGLKSMVAGLLACYLFAAVEGASIKNASLRAEKFSAP